MPGYISATQSVARYRVPKLENGLTAPPMQLDMYPEGGEVRCHLMIADWSLRRGTYRCRLVSWLEALIFLNPYGTR
jgi:hypothetical protein